jgi:hypothetical protein
MSLDLAQIGSRATSDGQARARIILAEHREQALKLVGHLFEYGRVSRAEFSSLIMGEPL